MRRGPTRRRYLATVGIGLAGSIAGCFGPGGGDVSSDSLPATFDDRIPELLDRYDVPGACIAFVQDGEVTWTGACGEADREEGRPMTTDTVFRAASITKSVTAWGILNLVERGEIELDDPIERHVTRWELPEAEFDTEAVTVRRLLSHTSGRQMGTADDDERYAPDEDLPAPEAILDGEGWGSAARFEHPPRSAFSYSNAGFALLELLIEG
ncbi:serine hydrolase domain-containing protein [Natrinema longum]|uniref:serine hydrolase domain-containing protein n=1 Tax=Natrinema longum TaxID=370324 RepID=UPI001CCCC755|nr:serine hydrolase domain-containing protein [Natrinema longum]MBZ6496885.1 beta-lactamase family protein [Natrinema longum]